MASALERAASSRRYQSWTSGAVKSVQGGGSAAHKFVKGSVDWAAFQTMRDPTPDVPVGTPEHHLKAREEFWHDLWEPLQGLPDDPCLGLSFPPVRPEDIASLPRPSLDRYRQMCRKYRPRTAVGLDGMHPRHHSQLPDASLIVLFGIWRAVLRLGRFPPVLSRNELASQVRRR